MSGASEMGRNGAKFRESEGCSKLSDIDDAEEGSCTRHCLAEFQNTAV